MGGKVAQLPAEGKGQGAKQKAESRNAEKEDQGTKGLKDQGTKGPGTKGPGTKGQKVKRGQSSLLTGAGAAVRRCGGGRSKGLYSPKY